MSTTTYLYTFKPQDLSEAFDAYLRLPITYSTITNKPVLYSEPEAKAQSQILTYLISTYGPPIKLRETN